MAASGGRRGLRRRSCAWAMRTLNGGYKAQVAVRKRAMFASLAGTVAEIGIHSPHISHLAVR